MGVYVTYQLKCQPMGIDNNLKQELIRLPYFTDVVNWCYRSCIIPCRCGVFTVPAGLYTRLLAAWST